MGCIHTAGGVKGLEYTTVNEADIWLVASHVLASITLLFVDSSTVSCGWCVNVKSAKFGSGLGRVSGLWLRHSERLLVCIMPMTTIQSVGIGIDVRPGLQCMSKHLQKKSVCVSVTLSLSGLIHKNMCLFASYLNMLSIDVAMITSW